MTGMRGALAFLIAALDMDPHDPGKRQTVRDAKERARAVVDDDNEDLIVLLADLVSFRITNDAGECSWCEADTPARTTDHRPSCPWRRAQEIIHASR